PLLLPHETPLLQIHLSNIHLQPPPTTTLFPYTTLFRSMKNEPGALYQLLEPFHRQGVDLTRVETRPSPSGTWAYVFYIDFEGHTDDEKAGKVLAEVEHDAVELKRLGSYPVGVL